MATKRPTGPRAPKAAQALGPRVRCITANNPSPMTGAGTNSYLVGRGGDLVLIDPGPDLESHLSAVMGALAPSERIAAIVVTHAHLDHSAAASAFAAQSGALVYAFGDALAGRRARLPAATAAVAGAEAESGAESRDGAAQGIGGGEGVDWDFRPNARLADGESLAGDWGCLRALHTPGHTGGHICLAYEDTLFSGDHAMGWSSSLISPPEGEMGAYMASLQRLMAHEWRVMLPGHGPVVHHPGARLGELWRHRKAREGEVLQTLAQEPKGLDAPSIARRLYLDTPAPLLGAAARNVLAHLIDLEARGEIACQGPLRSEAVFARAQS